jgi:hypothetical protein
MKTRLQASRLPGEMEHPPLKGKAGWEYAGGLFIAIWSSSLKGTTTPIGEGGNTSANGSVPPYNHSNQAGYLEVR